MFRRCRSITLIQSNMASKEGGAAAAPGPNPTGAFYPSQGDNWIAHDSVQANVLCVHSAMTPQLSSLLQSTPKKSPLRWQPKKRGMLCRNQKAPRDHPRTLRTRIPCVRDYILSHIYVFTCNFKSATCTSPPSHPNTASSSAHRLQPRPCQVDVRHEWQGGACDRRLRLVG